MMTVRTLVVSLGVAALAAVPLAGVAIAQPGDRDCPDFSSQQEAQDALDASIGDPERLDRDGDGQACENYDFGSSAPAPAPDVDEDKDEDDDEDDDAAGTPAPSAAPAVDGDGGQVAVVPRGGVDTGDGSADHPTTTLLTGGVIGLAAVAAAAGRRAHSAR